MFLGLWEHEVRNNPWYYTNEKMRQARKNMRKEPGRADFECFRIVRARSAEQSVVLYK